jgi:hypothetical protein
MNFEIRKILENYPEYRELVNDTTITDKALFIHFANAHPKDAETLLSYWINEQSWDDIDNETWDDDQHFNPLVLIGAGKSIVEMAKTGIKEASNIAKSIVNTAKNIASKHEIKIMPKEPKSKSSSEVTNPPEEKKQSNILLYIAVGIVALVVIIMMLKK